MTRGQARGDATAAASEGGTSERRAWERRAWERRTWERRTWGRRTWGRRAWERRTWERRAWAATMRGRWNGRASPRHTSSPEPVSRRASRALRANDPRGSVGEGSRITLASAASEVSTALIAGSTSLTSATADAAIASQKTARQTTARQTTSGAVRPASPARCNRPRAARPSRRRDFKPPRPRARGAARQPWSPRAACGPHARARSERLASKPHHAQTRSTQTRSCRSPGGPSPQSVEAHLVPRHNVGTAAREQETPISTDGRRSKHRLFFPAHEGLGQARQEEQSERLPL
jgi:hypothetical protein